MNPTKNSIKRILTAGAIAALALVAACGGGDSASGVAPPAIDPPPTSTGELNPGLPGRFWYRPSATATYWTAKADTGAATKFVDRSTSAQSLIPSRDGTQYLFRSFDAHSPAGTDNEVTTVEVFTSATKARIARFEINGYATAFRFSPDNRYIGMVWYPTILAANGIDQAGLTIIDLGTGGSPTPVVSFMNSGDTTTVYDFDWLPNSQYIYLRRDGQLVLGTINGDPKFHGKVAVPTTPDSPGASSYQLIRNLRASPDGKQLVFHLAWKAASLDRTDVWTGDTYGANLERVSKTDFGGFTGWSPDGRFMALTTNAGGTAIPGNGIAYCKRWYVPSAARNVSEDSASSRRLRYLDGSTVDYLPCFSDVFWTS